MAAFPERTPPRKAAVIMSLYADGLTKTEIARRMGMSRNGVSLVIARVQNDEEPPQRVLKPCGTVAAMQRHRRRGEVPCLPCLNAAAAENRAFRSKQVEAKFPIGTRVRHKHKRSPFLGVVRGYAYPTINADGFAEASGMRLVVVNLTTKERRLLLTRNVEKVGKWGRPLS